MPTTTQPLPPIRACIFDVDGTLINTEDIYTDIYNHILASYNKPPYPWRIKATQQSRGTPGTQRLLDWAQVGLTVQEWQEREKAYAHLFRESEVLPGVEKLLCDLATRTERAVRLALASSAGAAKFALKTARVPGVGAAFGDAGLRVFGDDPEMRGRRKKPAPDIFLLALRRINDAVGREGEAKIDAGECLVFEDSIAGVEAARRAGMRVVWVPHPGLAEVCAGREEEVLMGRTEADGTVPRYGEKVGSDVRKIEPAEDGRLLSEDGFAEMRASLEDFPYEAYGIRIVG